MLKKQYFLMAFILAFAIASNVSALPNKNAYQNAYEQLKIDAADYADEFCKTYYTLGNGAACALSSAKTFLQQMTTGTLAKAQKGATAIQDHVQESLKCAHGTYATVGDAFVQAYNRSADWLYAKDVKSKKTVIAAGRISAVITGVAIIGGVFVAAKKLFGRKAEKTVAVGEEPHYELASEPIAIEFDSVQKEEKVYPSLTKESLSLISHDEGRDWDASIAASISL